MRAYGNHRRWFIQGCPCCKKVEAAKTAERMELEREATARAQEALEILEDGMFWAKHEARQKFQLLELPS